MPRYTYAENPVHPVLNDYPAALLPASLVCDALHLVTRRPTFRNASFLAQIGTLGTGAAAAYTGYADYVEIPPGTETKRLANAHAALNVGLLGAVALNVLLRLRGRVTFVSFLLNLAANAGLVASSWYGTHLVYRHGMRVRGVDPIAAAPEAMPDMGKPYAEMLERAAGSLPATDLAATVQETGRQAAAKVDELRTDDGAAGTALRSVEQAATTARKRKAPRTNGGETDVLGDASGADETHGIEVAATSPTAIDR